MKKGNKIEYRINKEKIFLCCGKARCPSVSKGEDGMILITDDFGGMVKMPHDQANMINGALELMGVLKQDKKL